MKHMSHANNPDFVVDAPEGRDQYLESAGWAPIKPGPDPKDDKN